MEATLNKQAYDSYATLLVNDTQRQLFSERIQALEQLSANASEMAGFLANFSQTVAELYAANAVAVWFQSSETTQRKVDVGWQNLALDASNDDAHQKLIDYAMLQRKPIVVQPYAAPAAGAAVSNPTDSFLLLAPVTYKQQNVAVLEIALGPKPLRQPQQQLISSYLDWLRWLGRLLQNGIDRSFSQAAEPVLLALATVQRASEKADAIQDQIRQELEASLRTLAGQNFGSLKENQAVAKQIHALLDSKGLRMRCPECGAAAILRCQNAGNSKTGAFMFDHYLDTGRTFHGGQTTFPEVTLVSKPARRGQKR